MTSTIVIMAAGRGTRMQNVVPELPKHLVPVSGRPFLEHTLDRVRAAGFSDIVLVVGHRGEAFARYSNVPDIRIIKQDLDNGRYGTATVIETVRPHIDGNFACIAGDNLYSVTDLKKVSAGTSSCWVGGFKTAAWKGMGVLQLKDDGYLSRIIEKPTTFVGDLVNASIYLFTPTIFTAVEHLPVSPRGEYELTDAINRIASQEPVNVFELEERWLDLTRPDDITKIEKALGTAS